MSDLNDEDRALFEAARAGYEPLEADRRRVLSGVLLRAGVAAAVTGTATAGAAAGAPLASAGASSSIVGLTVKAAIWLAVGASVGVSGYAISHLRSSGVNAVPASVHARASGTSASAISEAGQAAPGTAAPNTVLAGPPEDPEASGPSAVLTTGVPSAGSPRPSEVPLSPLSRDNVKIPRATAASSPPVAIFPSEAPSAAARAPSPSASSLALSVEARALAEVQSDLKEGRSAEALKLVEEQRQQFVHGELQQERDAARIVALCAVGHIADARAAARDFLANSPRSPFAARIRASCAGQ
jgi:hypothetical protein